MRGHHFLVAGTATLLAGFISMDQARADTSAEFDAPSRVDNALDLLTPLQTPSPYLDMAILGGTQIAQADCTVDPRAKRDGKKDSSKQISSGCPIDPTKVGGAEEHPSGQPEMEHLLYSEYDFSSPIYQTLRGQLFSDSEFRYTWNTYNILDATGAKIGTHLSQMMSVIQAERYGVNDKLSLLLQVQEDPYSSIKVKDVGGGITRSDGGDWHEPEFGVLYRVYQPDDIPLAVDLKARYFSNFVTPNQRVALEERVGYVVNDLTLEFNSTTYYAIPDRYNGKPAPGYWADVISGEAFYFLTDKWSVEGDLSYQIMPGSGGDGTVSLHGEVNYTLIPDKFQLTLEYGHEFHSDTASVSDSSTDFVGMRLGYLFSFTGGD